jgi:hypothetical protein
MNGKCMAAAAILFFCQGALLAAEKPAGEAGAGLLFVQSVSSGGFSGDELTLSDADPLILYFSDRPQRLAGHMTVKRFLRLWEEGRDSFGKNPPNAVLSVLDDRGVENVVVELLSPSVAEGVWRYKVKVLSGKVPAAFGAASLFIDAFPAQANTKVLGDAPAMAMGNLYQATSQALANAAHNSVASSTATGSGLYSLSALRASTGPIP